MDVQEIVDVLEAGDDLMSVATLLGADCLNKQQAVRQDRYADESDTCSDLLARVIDESKTMWDVAGTSRRAPSGLLKDQLKKLSATPELATVTVLEGICRGIARDFFANASTVVTFDRGSVMPLPERWLHAIPTPPRPATTHPNLLGERCNFVLWDEDDWVLELDFTGYFELGTNHVEGVYIRRLRKRKKANRIRQYGSCREGTHLTRNIHAYARLRRQLDDAKIDSAVLLHIQVSGQVDRTNGIRCEGLLKGD